MLFRVANKEDTKQIVKLLKQLFDCEVEFIYDKKKQTNAVDTIISNSSIGTIYVANIEDKIIGCVSVLYTYSTALDSKVGIVEDMIIDKPYRDKDIGSKLLKYVIKQAKKQNLKRLTLLTDGSNKKAHKFYKKNRFTKSGMVIFRKAL